MLSRKDYPASSNYLALRRVSSDVSTVSASAGSRYSILRAFLVRDWRIFVDDGENGGGGGDVLPAVRNERLGAGIKGIK
ncbi:hypothetical protein M407DRAFT_246607 [Tulasnella calospora MUT 4182]|uniref:Uncharacterized protein n=1 Tax=Tulasnella calospora MUT 4182 TaxID=1051891 RepID=A0A0C3Q431_9AGAM|nr:hypothetical protein M407DRAFT_246607 [Tulasnella calospora MUT 4182]